MDVDATVRALLARYVVDGVKAPPNYSVRIGGSDAEGRGGRDLHLLYKSSTKAVRSRVPSRVLRGLVTYLASHTFTCPLDRLRTSAVALLADGDAVLAPPFLLRSLDVLQPRLERAGLRFVDAPFVQIDPAAAEVVVEPSALDVDDSILQALDGRFASSDREPPAVEPGRYPLRGWAVRVDRGLVGPVSPGLGLARAAHHVALDGREVQDLLDTLGDLFGRITPFAIWDERPPDLVPQLLELAGVP
jgi:hypothetical protein